MSARGRDLCRRKTKARRKLSLAERKQLQHHLTKVDRASLQEYVYRAMSQEHHLQVFPERKQFWEACVDTETLETLVGSFVSQFVSL